MEGPPHYDVRHSFSGISRCVSKSNSQADDISLPSYSVIINDRHRQSSFSTVATGLSPDPPNTIRNSSIPTKFDEK